jgi:hypothetical protein
MDLHRNPLVQYFLLSPALILMVGNRYGALIERSVYTNLFALLCKHVTDETKNLSRLCRKQRSKSRAKCTRSDACLDNESVIEHKRNLKLYAVCDLPVLTRNNLGDKKKSNISLLRNFLYRKNTHIGVESAARY